MSDTPKNQPMQNQPAPKFSGEQPKQAGEQPKQAGEQSATQTKSDAKSASAPTA